MCSICEDKAREALDDPLDDLLEGSTNVVSISERVDFAQKTLARAVAEPAKGGALYEEPCKDCRGSGKFRSYTGRIVGDCFKCKGTGKKVFKTSPEARAKNAADKKARHLAKITAWTEAHPAEFQWIVAAAGRGFNFAADMLTTLNQYGDLNSFKLDKVRQFMIKDQLRAEEKAEIEARAPQIEGAPLEKIEQAFATALENQIRFPKLRLDTFIFSPVQSGVNAGSIYVKHATEIDRNGDKRYLGKITEGRFVRRHGTSIEEEQRIIAAAMDPEAAAKAYGQRMGACSICGRALTRNESIDRAVGPICAEKYGWL